MYVFTFMWKLDYWFKLSEYASTSASERTKFQWKQWITFSLKFADCVTRY